MALTAILYKTVTYLVTTGSKKLFKSITAVPAFKSAAKLTADAFPDLEVMYALEKWCGTADFDQLTESMLEGKKPEADEAIVRSFIDSGGFYYPGAEAEKASAVLTKFFHELERQITLSPDGPATVAARTEVRHKELTDSIQTVNAHLAANRSNRVAERAFQSLCGEDQAIAPGIKGFLPVGMCKGVVSSWKTGRSSRKERSSGSTRKRYR
ncbi:MAG: hypothetical protein JNN07_23205 [Verrucomicrobiales bacterium]|nr:hypothetical protein [Verrucomicrobiales bacterium]